MFAHLSGRKHRENFASLKLGEEAVLGASQVSVSPVLQTSLSHCFQADLLKIAWDYDESQSAVEERIRTVRSDEVMFVLISFLD